MTDEQQHLIATRAILIGLDRPDSASAVMDAAGVLWRTRLSADTAEVFSALCPPQEQLVLERLELRLGFIADRDFASEFPARYRAILLEELPRQLRRLRGGDGAVGRVIPGGRSTLELLEFLLLHGFMPWWGPQDSQFDPAEALLSALAEAPAAAAGLVRRAGRLRRVRLRLVRWLDDPGIAGLIRAVAPGEADFILRYAQDLDARQREIRFVEAGADEFREAKWEILLGHLLGDHGSRFNEKSFVVQTLRAIASRFRLRYTELLRELLLAASASGITWREGSLPRLLAEISSEENSRSPGETPGIDTPGSLPHGAWLAAWSAALSGQSAPRGGELAFWRELPAGEARELAGELISRHGVRALVGILAQFVAPGDAAELLQILAAPAPGETTRLGGRIRALEVALAGILPPRDLALDPVRAGDGEGVFSPEALGILLETGRLPEAAWARSWSGRAREWLDRALAVHADDAARLLRGWAREGRLRTMAGRLPDSLLELVVYAVQPAHADGVIALVRAAASARPAGAANPSAWRDSAWQGALDHLLGDSGAACDARSLAARTVRELAERHQVGPGLVVELLAEQAERAGQRQLLYDLREAEVSGFQSSADERQDPAALAQPRSFINERSLRRSALVRMRMLKLVLSGSPAAGEAWARKLLPLLWELLAADSKGGQLWRAALGRALGDHAVADLVLRTGGERVVGDVLFAGEPAQALLWRDALSWMEAHATALGPLGRPGASGELWRALVELWKMSGAVPLRDAAQFLARALLRAGLLPGAGAQGGSPAEQSALEALHAVLQRSGDREALRIAARLPRTMAPRAAALREPANELDRPDGGEEKQGVKGEQNEESGEAEDRLSPIAVNNAGLVLLAPFFGELFGRCSLLEAGVFRDFRAAQRAVHLLQSLATGGARTHEYSLVLNKILCGLDPGVAVVARIELKEGEEEACRALLQRVAASWPRGAHLSVEGLRASYLLRAGWVRRDGDRWKLQVERRGWDVLLPELPWSFPGPRPAWMSRSLQVDWI